MIFVQVKGSVKSDSDEDCTSIYTDATDATLENNPVELLCEMRKELVNVRKKCKLLEQENKEYQNINTNKGTGNQVRGMAVRLFQDDPLQVF